MKLFALINKMNQLCADRNQGIEYAEELEAACRQIKNYVNNLETEMKERAALLELLEQSQLYYDAQSSEANMVAMVGYLPIKFLIVVFVLSDRSVEFSVLFSLAITKMIVFR